MHALCYVLFGTAALGWANLAQPCSSAQTRMPADIQSGTANISSTQAQLMQLECLAQALTM
jgi:hypothetical protein